MVQNIRIVPAILANDALTLNKLVRQAETFADFVQIDIMDGEFVPSCSISFQDIAALKPKFKWETHLMVHKPENYLEGFKQAGAQKIVFHFEAKTEHEKTISLIRKLGMRVGLAVNPKTTIKDFLPLVKQVDSVLFLSVEPGFYGAEFIPAVLNKIVTFRETFPEMEIGIDGGIKENNIIEIARTGVNAICVGSAIFNRPSPAAAYRSLAILTATV
ncbi:MAG: ribulose-phosphate 3-epimerase [Dehalococcoidales bacterium]